MLTLQDCKQSIQNLFISGQFITKQAPVFLQLESLLASYWRELHGLEYLRTERNPADKKTYILLMSCYYDKWNVIKKKEKKIQSSLTASWRSWLISLYEDGSLAILSSDFSLGDKVLEKEFVNGSEFFRTKGFPQIGAFKFAPCFHDPFPPPSFQSLYDLSARTQFTTLADFPPCKVRRLKQCNIRLKTLTK